MELQQRQVAFPRPAAHHSTLIVLIERKGLIWILLAEAASHSPPISWTVFKFIPSSIVFFFSQHNLSPYLCINSIVRDFLRPPLFLYKYCDYCLDRLSHLHSGIDPNPRKKYKYFLPLFSLKKNKASRRSLPTIWTYGSLKLISVVICARRWLA